MLSKESYIQLLTWLLMTGTVGMAFEASRRERSLGLRLFTSSPGINLLLIATYGCLAAAVAFVGEWALREVGVSRELSGLIIKVSGWIIIAAIAAHSIRSWTDIGTSKEKADALLTTALIGALIFFTPRTFNYDTGLYHLPFVQHLNRLGLEWNAAWIHTRYAYFNAQLYGQALLHRLMGVHGYEMLPSLNILYLGGLILYFKELIRQPRRSLATFALGIGMMRVIWLTFIPSESSESMHSYNADFSLGCIILSLALACWIDQRFRHSAQILIPATVVPALKLSGLACLLPVAWNIWANWRTTRNPERNNSLLAAFVVGACIVGMITITSWIQAGYAVYPAAQTGPLRQAAIPKATVKEESEKWTIAFARYAYAGQLDNIKINASPVEWIPAWSKSDNGKQMLTCLYISLGIFIYSQTAEVDKRLSSLCASLLVFWLVAILALPPDPRFYMGPRWITQFLFFYQLALLIAKLLGVGPAGKHEADSSKVKTVSNWLSAYIMSCLFFVSIWRKSEFNALKAPQPATTVSTGFNLPYDPPKGVKVHKIIGTDSRCWGAPSPCKN